MSKINIFKKFNFIFILENTFYFLLGITLIAFIIMGSGSLFNNHFIVNIFGNIMFFTLKIISIILGIYSFFLAYFLFK